MRATAMIEDVKTRHEHLYDRVLRDAPKLRRALTVAASADPRVRPTADDNSHQALLREINDLLENLTKLSSQVNSFEEYRWLSHAAVKWQNVFSFLDVPTFVKL